MAVHLWILKDRKEWLENRKNYKKGEQKMIIAQAGRVMMAGDLEENISETLSVIDSLRDIIINLDDEKLRDELTKEVSDDMVDIFFLGIDEVAHRMRQKRGDEDVSEDDNADGQE